jgi:hypothetical protein
MSDKMREEFEAAYQAESDGRGKFQPAPFTTYPDGAYAIPMVDMAWWAWQASRAALLIELPRDDVYCDDEAIAALNDCREAIETAGVKCT